MQGQGRRQGSTSLSSAPRRNSLDCSLSMGLPDADAASSLRADVNILKQTLGNGNSSPTGKHHMRATNHLLKLHHFKPCFLTLSQMPILWVSMPQNALALPTSRLRVQHCPCLHLTAMTTLSSEMLLPAGKVPKHSVDAAPHLERASAPGAPGELGNGVTDVAERQAASMDKMREAATQLGRGASLLTPDMSSSAGVERRGELPPQAQSPHAL